MAAPTTSRPVAGARWLPFALPLPRTDALLWAATLVLVPFGVLMVHSASLGEPPYPRITPAALRQVEFAAVGAALMLAVARLDYRALRRFAFVGYLAGLVALIAVLVAGIEEHGARRWLGAGTFTIQPAEFAKPLFVLALAAYMGGRGPRPAALAVTVAAALVPAALVVTQPDLGTALVFGGCWLAMVVAWGVRWRVFAGLLAAGAAVGPLLFALGVSDYQRERLAVFVDPSRDPLGSGFNLRQAEVAIGSGGLTGNGLFGDRSELDVVAARSSDFMFALIGEELGLLGGALLLALLALVVWRGFAAARRAPDAFGRLLAVGLTSVVLVQAFVNVAVNLRLFPATGIPLPFISQGGSSLVTMLVIVGLLQSVTSRRPVSGRSPWRTERGL